MSSRVDEIRERWTYAYKVALPPYEQVRADIDYLLSLVKDGGAADDLPRGYWPTLVDRGDGVKGHYCIGRLINPDKSYWEFWNHGKWLSAGQLFIGREVALATLNKIRATTPTESSKWCGGCFHFDSRDSLGFCQHPVPVASYEPEMMPCSCKCVFPASEQAGEQRCEKCCGHDSKFTDEQKRCWYSVNGKPCGHRCGWVTIGTVHIDRESETETFTPAPAPSVAQPKADPGALNLAREIASHIEGTTPLSVGGPLMYQIAAIISRRRHIHAPSTASPSTTAQEAAKELENMGFLDRDHFVEVSDARRDQVAAIISKHCGGREIAEDEPDIYDVVAEYRQRVGADALQLAVGRMDEIKHRRDEAVRTTKEKGWIHTRSPTWTDINDLLSFIDLMRFQLFAAQEANRLGDKEITRLNSEVERLSKMLDDAHVRNAEDQDEHSEQRARLVQQFATARADAIGECVGRLSQFGREIRKVDAIAALEQLKNDQKSTPTGL